MNVESADGWYVYVLECEGGSLYTGITSDLKRRIEQHRRGTGARYTRAFPPRRLLAAWTCPDRGTASAAESSIKKLDAASKRRLVGDGEMCLDLSRVPPAVLADKSPFGSACDDA